MKENLMAQERGAVLVVCIILLAILSIMGAAAIITTSTETKIAANSRKAEQAFYAADAGIEFARREIDYRDTEAGDIYVHGDSNEDDWPDAGGDPMNYRVRVLGRITQGTSRIFNVESVGWDPNTRSRRIIRADIESFQTEGAVDEGGFPEM